MKQAIMHNKKIKIDMYMYMYLAFCRKSASTVIVDKYDPSSNLYGTTENKIIILVRQRVIFIIKVLLVTCTV